MKRRAQVKSGPRNRPLDHGAGKLWPKGLSVNKVYQHTDALICWLLSMAALRATKAELSATKTEAMQPAKSKIFTARPFTEKVCQPLL